MLNRSAVEESGADEKHVRFPSPVYWRCNQPLQIKLASWMAVNVWASGLIQSSVPYQIELLPNLVGESGKAIRKFKIMAKLRYLPLFELTLQFQTLSSIEIAENDYSFGENILGLFDEAHFWLNGYVNKQNCRIWSEANPQVYVETPLHPEKLTVWCALWAGGILLQKR
ncbi:hypothetical protein TNCV_3156081 [Trichonephila clavipes]|nr:hypothetical protein TNCV_3156081 [Trichonephila clavipes]